MSWQIPNETRYTFKLKSQGIVVWAIQHALNDVLAPPLVEDGWYGAKTQRAVVDFQQNAGLLDDGIFGPASSQQMAVDLENQVTIPLPAHLIRGFVEGESGGHIGAVNWSAPGGVDLSYLQRRVYSADYPKNSVVERAFSGSYQFGLLAGTTKNRHDLYLPRSGVQMVAGPLSYIPTENERAWRLAALSHNWPWAGDRLSRGFSLSDKTAPWVPDGVTFADGIPVETYWDWARKYALGAPNHGDPGMVTQYVEDWNP